jgi:DNA-binding HxlR family transcriptional regulator
MMSTFNLYDEKMADKMSRISLLDDFPITPAMLDTNIKRYEELQKQFRKVYRDSSSHTEYTLNTVYKRNV